jgi:hypothetical protein
MIKTLSITLLLITFAVILIPAVSYACGKNHKKTEKSCAKKESNSKTEKADKKSLCNEDPCKGEHSTKDRGCGSNCNHSNCKCVHFTVTIALAEENLLKDTIINFSARKHSVINTENNLSEGFHSIWQPPKIS